MNDNDPLEEELRRLRPSPAPDAFVDALLAIGASPSENRKDSTAPASGRWKLLLARFFRSPSSFPWLAAPAFGLAVVAALLLWRHFDATATTPASRRLAVDFQPDSITVSQEVLARYDGGIVQQPDGEVVRLTCYDREDRVILKDSRLGSVVEHREPRREIVPVHLEVY
jgi:hypothetical protein